MIGEGRWAVLAPRLDGRRAAEASDPVPGTRGDAYFHDMASPSDLAVECLRGPQVLPYLEDVARLRIEVFRDYPYLYEGDPEYERRYLAAYAATDTVFFAIARHRGEIIGVSTALALTDAEEELRTPFDRAGIALSEVCYFGESVVLRAFRGQGLGHEFFDAREAHARALGTRFATFCAVDRPPNHPLRPMDYRPLEGFWAKRGYRLRPDLRGELRWKEIGEHAESPKPMVFWLRSLN